MVFPIPNIFSDKFILKTEDQRLKTANLSINVSELFLNKFYDNQNMKYWIKVVSHAVENSALGESGETKYSCVREGGLIKM